VRDQQLDRALECAEELAHARLFVGAEDGHEATIGSAPWATS
jgi:hypothetical protein